MQTKKETVTRVRILIMGAAGVGKTTILRKICSEETPIVRNPEGELIQGLASLQPTLDRGLHDVNLEITYPSSPGFVFHDSRGIEAGTANELNEIRQFLDRRAKKEQDAVHVIWYCVSAATCRPLPAAETQFFELDRGKVPVITIFTKFDGLLVQAFNDLKNEGLERRAANQGAVAKADWLLQTHFVNPIMKMANPPMGYVTFQGLHKPEGQCAELTRKTVESLGHNQNIQMMFVLASKYDLKARLDAAAKYGQINGTDEDIVKATIAYFPHVWYTGHHWSEVDELLLDWWEDLSSSVVSGLLPCQWEEEVWRVSMITPIALPIALTVQSKLLVTHQLRSLAILAGTCIVADICFWTSQRAESSKMGQEELLSSLQHALNLYQQDKKDVIIQAMCQLPHGLSKEDMSDAVKHLILQHCQVSPVAL